MGFTALDTPAGLRTLNDFLIDRSYIDGYVASQADVAVFEALKGKAPERESAPYAARWYKHIAAMVESFAKLPGTKADASAYGPASAPVPSPSDDLDLFGSDEEEDKEAERIRAERLAAYHAKKAAKPATIAKSTVVLDVKPLEDTTDLAELERLVRQIKLDGLVWGASKIVPIAFGICKIQISCVVEDEKVSVDTLEEQIMSFDDMVNSVDIESFNKV